MKDIFLFVDILSRFEVTRFRLTAVGKMQAKFDVSPANFFTGAQQ